MAYEREGTTMLGECRSSLANWLAHKRVAQSSISQLPCNGVECLEFSKFQCEVVTYLQRLTHSIELGSTQVATRFERMIDAPNTQAQ